MALRDRCDVAILGGGLAGGLIALALAARRPDLKLLLIEAEEGIGGDHLWSFFENDIDRDDRWLIAPLVSHSWRDYDVAFPGHRRTLESAYHTVRSTVLESRVREVLAPESILTGQRVHSAGSTNVLLADDRLVEAGGVIDARGPADLNQLECGWQKFVGHEVRLAQPHALDRPIIMDAALEQIDGFRFLYVLPFAEDRLLIEDTYYSDRPKLVTGVVAPRVQHYAAARGWRVAEIIREESGVLPIAMGGDFEAYWRSGGDGVAKAGMRAGLFHPVTGYSLPDAVRVANLVSSLDDLSGPALHDTLHAHAAEAWENRGFYRMLSRMLFRAAMPPERWKILDAFYRNDRRLIARFYAGRSTLSDKAKILSGKPPVSIGRALGAVIGRQ